MNYCEFTTMIQKKPYIGLVDADLLDGGTRHPNLALLKIAGFLFDNSIEFELIEDSNADISKYTRIYLSKVFTFTKLPQFYCDAQSEGCLTNIIIGGTGFYAGETNIQKFKQLRQNDMQALEKDEFLCRYNNQRAGANKKGINMASQMPYYRLYEARYDRGGGCS